ncbi:MAG TPA: hypothetical protein DIT55_03200 [Spirochaetaceae bacterium]|nr:hypothetical protein [Spirochaetaceae bacterium]
MEMSPAFRSILAAGCGLLFSGILLLSGAMAGIERGLYDMEARASARFYERGGELARGGAAGDQVELIYVDQYSLGWVEKNLGLAWPWPREVYGIIASFLSEAKAQAFDILFSEASSYGPEDDARCAEAMDEAGNVVIAEAVGSGGSGRLTPLPTANVGFGRVTALVDPDGILRRYALGGGSKDGTQSLGLAVLERAGEKPPEFPGGSVYLRFYGASPSLPARNAAEILASAMSAREGRKPQVDPDLYKGKYVFIGFSAAGLFDRQAVPTDRAMPGAEIHATFVDNLLRGRLLAALPPAFDVSLILIFALAAAWASSFLKKPVFLTAGASLAVLIPPLAGFAFYRAGLVASTGFGMSAGFFSYAAGIILSYVSEGRNKAFLRRSFSQYLSPPVIEALLKNPGLLKLGGEERVITVFFSDIQGFTTLAESMDPGQLAAFMNRYLSIVTGEILREGGTVDKYVGDAVVAFWNAPLDQEDHASRAVRAALACLGALSASSGDFEALGTPMPFTRIGIHTGKAIVGNMGSPSRFNYTALGDVVNVGSRLENANKATGTALLVSGDTVAACVAKGLEFRRLGEILVHGRKAPIEVWEPRFEGESPGGSLAWAGLKDCSSI